MESEPLDGRRATSVGMGSRRFWGVLAAAAFAGACAADPGDSPKDDAGKPASASSGGSTSSGGGSGSSSSGATAPPPAGDDASDATVAPPADDSSTPALEASPPPPPPSCTTCPLTVEYFASDPPPDKSSELFHVAISNHGAMPQALSELTLRYWFTAEGVTTFTAHMYYAALSTITTSTLAQAFVPLSAASTPPATAKADTYMQVSFTAGAGSIPAMGSTNDIQLEFNDSSYQATETEADDYSYTATDTKANCEGGNNVLTCQTTTITLYRSGTLVWGTEPGGATPPPADAGSQPADQ
jgi:Cellulose binding domain